MQSGGPGTTTGSETRRARGAASARAPLSTAGALRCFGQCAWAAACVAPRAAQQTARPDTRCSRTAVRARGTAWSRSASPSAVDPWPPWGIRYSMRTARDAQRARAANRATWHASWMPQQAQHSLSRTKMAGEGHSRPQGTAMGWAKTGRPAASVKGWAALLAGAVHLRHSTQGAYPARQGTRMCAGHARRTRTWRSCWALMCRWHSTAAVAGEPLTEAAQQQ